MKKIKRSWKPTLHASAVEVRYGAAAVFLVVTTRFFQIQLGLPTGRSAKLRSAMEMAEKNASTIEWKERNGVGFSELVP